jgi:hypothetical protein
LRGVWEALKPFNKSFPQVIDFYYRVYLMVRQCGGAQRLQRIYDRAARAAHEMKDWCVVLLIHEGTR